MGAGSMISPTTGYVAGGSFSYFVDAPWYVTQLITWPCQILWWPVSTAIGVNYKTKINKMVGLSSETSTQLMCDEKYYGYWLPFRSGFKAPWWKRMLYKLSGLFSTLFGGLIFSYIAYYFLWPCAGYLIQSQLPDGMTWN